MEPTFAAFILGMIVLFGVVMVEVATRAVSNLIATVKHRRRQHKREVR